MVGGGGVGILFERGLLYSLDSLRYFRGIIRDVYVHYDGLRSITLDIIGFPDVSPGQFVMVWLPGVEEVPISPSLFRDGVLRLTVKSVGDTTRMINSLGEGGELYIRGPYGSGFDLSMEGSYLLVAGGYGAAPIIFVAHRLLDAGYSVSYVEGVKTASERVFFDEARGLGIDAVLVTEDGSSGVEGLVTMYVEEVVGDYDYVLACGPEDMLREVFRICIDSGADCQLSLERMVKCGVGICGSCVLEGSDRLICLDGPVFRCDELRDIGFG